MPDKMTVFSKDRQWKADLKAFKNWAFFYKSIGSDVSVYHMEKTTNIWGNSTTDWVSHSASIFISNVYKGSSGSGLGTFTQTQSSNGSSAELKLWAVGLISITITGVGPEGATLDIDSVDATIAVETPGGVLSGTVSASSALSDNSIWG
jgi:hypothetical protein